MVTIPENDDVMMRFTEKYSNANLSLKMSGFGAYIYKRDNYVISTKDKVKCEFVGVILSYLFTSEMDKG